VSCTCELDPIVEVKEQIVKDLTVEVLPCILGPLSESARWRRRTSMLIEGKNILSSTVRQSMS